MLHGPPACTLGGEKENAAKHDVDVADHVRFVRPRAGLARVVSRAGDQAAGGGVEHRGLVRGEVEVRRVGGIGGGSGIAGIGGSGRDGAAYGDQRQQGEPAEHLAPGHRRRQTVTGDGPVAGHGQSMTPI